MRPRFARWIPTGIVFLANLIALVALSLLSTSCRSSVTIPTRAHPEGESIDCIGVTRKHERAGIDYDLSVRNTFWGIIGFEFIAPPIVVLHHETFCPVADTSSTAAKVTP